MNTQVAPIALKISNIAIRQDASGRYCLNDLHKASGNNTSHRPSFWLSSKQAKDLIAELEKDDSGIPLSKILTARIPAVKKTEGRYGATYARKELVYAYGMWISAAFSLKVIRAYDALHNPPSENPQPLPSPSAQLRTKLLVTIEGDEIKQEVVPFGCVVVDPKSAMSLRTLMLECVPFDLLTIVFCAANSRMVEGMEKIQKARPG